MGGGADNQQANRSTSGNRNPNPPPSYQDPPPSYHTFAPAYDRYSYIRRIAGQDTIRPTASSSSNSRSVAKPDGGYGGSTDVPRSKPIDIPIPKKITNDHGGRG